MSGTLDSVLLDKNMYSTLYGFRYQAQTYHSGAGVHWARRMEYGTMQWIDMIENGNYYKTWLSKSSTFKDWQQNEPDTYKNFKYSLSNCIRRNVIRLSD